MVKNVLKRIFYGNNMNDFYLFLNTIFALYCWKKAAECFNDEENKEGWVFIFLSALNGAAVASLLFKG